MDYHPAKSIIGYLLLVLLAILVACSPSTVEPTAPIAPTEPLATIPPANAEQPTAASKPIPTSTPEPCGDIDFTGVWYGTRTLVETGAILSITLTLEQTGCDVSGKFEGDVSGRIEGEINEDGILIFSGDGSETRYELSDDVLIGLGFDDDIVQISDDYLERVASERINTIE